MFLNKDHMFLTAKYFLRLYTSYKHDLLVNSFKSLSFLMLGCPHPDFFSKYRILLSTHLLRLAVTGLMFNRLEVWT